MSETYLSVNVPKTLEAAQVTLGSALDEIESFQKSAHQEQELEKLLIAINIKVYADRAIRDVCLALELIRNYQEEIIPSESQSEIQETLAQEHKPIQREQPRLRLVVNNAPAIRKEAGL
jgi:hypothetical protein